jgi:hypothetical protein
MSGDLFACGEGKSFRSDSGKVEAFAEGLVGCGRLLGQSGDLRNGVLVGRGPGQQVKILVVKNRYLLGILPVEPGSVSHPDLRGVAFDRVYPRGGGILGGGKSAPVGLQHCIGHWTA